MAVEDKKKWPSDVAVASIQKDPESETSITSYGAVSTASTTLSLNSGCSLSAAIVPTIIDKNNDKNVPKLSMCADAQKVDRAKLAQTEVSCSCPFLENHHFSEK